MRGPVLRRQAFDLFSLLTVALFYLLNRLWLCTAAEDWIGWFLSCYANDLCAGAAILAWLDLMLSLGGRPPLRSRGAAFCLLLLCGLVWEGLAPLWKSRAVFDLWDLLAYQAGGFFWHTGFLCLIRTP